MVIADRVHRAEPVQVVLERDVVAVPRNHVERGETHLGCENGAAVLVEHLVLALSVLVECNRALKVARVGKAIRANWAEVREDEVAVEDLTDVATRWLVNVDGEANAALWSHTVRR